MIPFRARITTILGLLLGLAAAASPARAGGGTVHLYAVDDRGRVRLGGTLLDRLPGKYDLGNFDAPFGQHRWADFVLDGADRYGLRLDGVIDWSGDPSTPLHRLAYPLGTGAAWFRLDVDGGSVAAIRTDGLLAVDGVDDGPPFDRDKFYFSDLARLNGDWFALRTDGSVFRAGTPDPCLKFTGDDTQGGLEGRTSNAEWLVLEADTSAGDLVALRSDGQIFRGDPGGCDPEGDPPPEFVVELEFSSGISSGDLYGALVVLDDGSFYALRGNGELYRSDLIMDPDNDDESRDGLLTDLPGNGRRRSNHYPSLVVLDGEAWCLRGDGRIYRGEALAEGEKHEPVLDLPRGGHVRLVASTDAPDTTDAVTYDPVAAAYRARVVEGTSLTIPMLVTDVDTLADDLVLDVPDLGELPAELGAVWDPGDATVTLSPALGARGKHRFTLTVDEDDADPESELHEFRYKVKVIAADGDPNRERPPSLARVTPVQALVDVPLDLPILVADPDGVAPALSVLTELPEGATFHEPTGVLSWTPTLDQVGRAKIRVLADDGRRRRKTRVIIDVINPIVFD